MKKYRTRDRRLIDREHGYVGNRATPKSVGGRGRDARHTARKQMVNTTASKFIVQSLVDAGVRHIYGGHGGALVPLVNAVVDHPQVEWVCTVAGNASLAAAASAAGRMGGLGCCIAASGPGASTL